MIIYRNILVTLPDIAQAKSLSFILLFNSSQEIEPTIIIFFLSFPSKKANKATKTHWVTEYQKI